MSNEHDPAILDNIRLADEIKSLKDDNKRLRQLLKSARNYVAAQLTIVNSADGRVLRDIIDRETATQHVWEDEQAEIDESNRLNDDNDPAQEQG